jgi:hypothetical protein
LFGKKKETNCPICGQELKTGIFGDAVKVADGFICGACASKLRNDFPVKEGISYSYQGAKRIDNNDPLTGFTIKYIKERMEDMG